MKLFKAILYAAVGLIIFTPVIKANTPAQLVKPETNDQTSPDLYDSVIIWEFNNDIVGYNLKTDTYFTVCNDSGMQKNPAIYDNLIAWSHEADSSEYISCLNLTTDQSTVLSSTSSSNLTPAVHNGKVVWQINKDILGSDLVNSFMVSDDPANQSRPDIYNDIVVWDEYSNGSYDIYCKDLSTGNVKPVCQAEGTQMFPRIHGEIVVWCDYRNGNFDIFMYNLSTDIEKAVCTAAGDQIHPAVYGDTIVWAHDGGSTYKISGYNITNGTEFTIRESSSELKEPEIHKNIVVWEGQNGNARAIYYAELTEPTSFQITGPNGGEMILQGTDLELTWQTAGEPVDHVYLEYSADSGANWQLIDANVPETGSYTWTTPDIDSQECLVRISRKDDPSVGDISDNVFTVFKCSANLTADMTGDCMVDLKDFLKFCSQWMTAGNPYESDWKPLD